MRILHTADWHLGISTGPTSRVEEQQWFLDWLLDTLDSREIDALIVAGDIFDSMHPSAEAQELYYRFVARVETTGVKDVVIVGGNHDSASRLDAPRALLETVNVHVVGGMPGLDGDRFDRMIVPLRERGSDEAAAVCLAVPYVHEYRLGIRTTDLDLDQTRAAFRTAFADLYRSLADGAIERYRALPLVATGHLTLGTEVTRDDYPQEIHQVGTIEGLPIDILDPRIEYTALGHIHRCYAIANSSAWYCGSPIPYSLTEMSTDRHVVVVDLEEGTDVAVDLIKVPLCRKLVQLTGTPDSVLAEVIALKWSTLLPPLIHVRVETNVAEPGLIHRLHEAVATHPPDARPILVEVQQRSTEAAVEGDALVAPPLEELQPEEVFALLCDAQKWGGDDRTALDLAFGTVASATDEDLEVMLAAIELPATAQGDGR